MAKRIFPVEGSTPDSRALTKMLVREYGLPKGISCRLHRRSVGDVYEIRSRSRAWYLKVYLTFWQPWEAVEAEAELLLGLSRRGIPVAVPLRTRGGKCVTTIRCPEGDRAAVLFRGVSGGEFEEANKAHSKAFGTAVARMHNAADRMADVPNTPRFDFEHLIDDQLRVVEPFMKHRKRDFRFIARLGEDAKAAIDALLAPSKPQWGICHGDLHGSDARIDGEGRVTLFDFSSFGVGWRAVDIGVYLASHKWMDTDSKTRAERRRKWQAFLEGYSRERELTRAEIEAAEASVAVRHIYLMGVPLACWTRIAGHHWITDGYFDWHMKWFRAWHEKKIRLI